MGAVLAHPATAVGRSGVADARAPAQPVVVAGHGHHLEVGEERVVGGQTTEADELLAHHRRLQRALRRQGGVLEVAAAAQSGSGDRARGPDPVR